MAGGQERILRRRIKSVQSTRKITKAMELIAASQISRSQARIVANRPYRNGMRRIIVEAAKADPAGAAKLLATPEHVESAHRVGADRRPGTLRRLQLLGDARGRATRAKARRRRDDRSPLQRREEGRRLLPLPRVSTSKRASRACPTDRSFTDARRVAARRRRTVRRPATPNRFSWSRRGSSPPRPRASKSNSCCRSSMPALPIEDGARKYLKGYTEFEPEVEQLLITLAPRGPRE